MGDTPEYVEQLYYDMIMSRTPEERLGMASSMFESCRALVAAGIESDGKTRTPAELRAEVFRRIYAEDFPAEEMERIVDEMLSPWRVSCKGCGLRIACRRDSGIP